MIRVVQQVYNLSRKAVDYHTCPLIKKSATYNVDVAHELRLMAQKTVVQMKDGTFSRKSAMSVINCFYLIGFAGAAVKSPVALSSSVNDTHEGALLTYSEVV